MFVTGYASKPRCSPASAPHAPARNGLSHANKEPEALFAGKLFWSVLGHAVGRQLHGMSDFVLRLWDGCEAKNFSVQPLSTLQKYASFFIAGRDLILGGWIPLAIYQPIDTHVQRLFAILFSWIQKQQKTRLAGLRI